MADYICERYDSIDKLMATITGRKVNSIFAGDQYSVSGGSSFAGTESWDQAVDFITHGWEEPLAKIKEGLTASMKVKTNTSAPKHRPTTGLIGYAPCVPNAILGLPNSMISTERTPQKVKAVTLIYSPTVAGSWSTDSLIKAGVAVMRLVNDLELKGYRVKLVCEAMSTVEGKDFAQVFVDLKDWRQPIDLKKLAFPMVNPSMLRRIAFRWLETLPGLKNSGYRYGYGHPKCGENYERVVKEYRDKNIIGDKDYFITAYMAKKEKYDAARIAKRAGIAELL